MSLSDLSSRLQGPGVQLSPRKPPEPIAALSCSRIQFLDSALETMAPTSRSPEDTKPSSHGTRSWGWVGLLDWFGRSFGGLREGEQPAKCMPRLCRLKDDGLQIVLGSEGNFTLTIREEWGCQGHSIYTVSAPTTCPIMSYFPVTPSVQVVDETLAHPTPDQGGGSSNKGRSHGGAAEGHVACRSEVRAENIGASSMGHFGIPGRKYQTLIT